MIRWPHYDEVQIADVVEVLRSGKVNAWTGPHVGDFERAYERYLGRKHCIALANGSLALDLALRVLGIGSGDEVIVTPRSFLASASAVPLAGGTAVFADVDPDSQNLTADTIAAKLSSRTKAVIVVHLAGWPCDMDPIAELAEKHDLWLIEDCAQAHGAEYKGRPVGSFGDIAIFSFCQDKIITTGGEGGLLAVDDDRLWDAAWSFKDHGKSRAAVQSRQQEPGFRWLHESFGTNMRMTSVQAVLGLRQLEYLGDWHRQRASNAQFLIRSLVQHEALRTPVPPSYMRHAWYRLYAFVVPERLKEGWNRDRILLTIREAGGECLAGSCPEIYLEKAFQGLAPAARLPVARELGETSLAFLVDPGQNEDSLGRTLGITRAVLSAASLP